MIASMFRQRLAYASEWGRWALVMEEDPARPRADVAREAEIVEMIRVLPEDPEKSGSAAVVAGRMAARRALRSLLVQSKPETRTALLAYVQERAATLRRHAQREGPIGYIAPAVALANDLGKRCETPGAGPVITQESSCGLPGARLSATGRATAYCEQAVGGQTAKTSSPLSAAALGSCGVGAPEDRTYVPECKPEFFTTTSSSASSATITGTTSWYVPAVGCTAIATQGTMRAFDTTETGAAIATMAASPDCAYIVNFRQVSATPLSGGALSFRYEWSSSTGTQSDLSGCTVGESVFYPGSDNPYEWPLPMVQQTVNPTVVSGSGANAGMTDINGAPGSYRTPYYAVEFKARQRFWWKCTGYQNGEMQYPLPDIEITRRVYRDASGAWKYQMTKSGETNTATLP